MVFVVVGGTALRLHSMGASPSIVCGQRKGFVFHNVQCVLSSLPV